MIGIVVCKCSCVCANRCCVDVMNDGCDYVLVVCVRGVDHVVIVAL